jgi:hypothetical protein
LTKYYLNEIVSIWIEEWNMSIDRLNMFFLETKSKLEIIENLIGKDIEKVKEEFNLRPRHGIKEKGIQEISKKNITENIDGLFYFYNRKFYKFIIEKSIYDQMSNDYLLKIFQKEYGILVASFDEENLSPNIKKMFYTCKKQLNLNNVLVIKFTDITNTSPVMLESLKRIFSISIIIYNSDMENEVQKKLENPEIEIQWFRELSDLELENIMKSTENSDLFNNTEIKFINTMIQKKQNNEVPTYRQLKWFMTLFEKTQNNMSNATV